jgi:hypothetical protein
MKTHIFISDLTNQQQNQIRKDIWDRFLDIYAAENYKTTNNGEYEDWITDEIENELNEKVDDFISNHEGWELEI